MVTCVSSEVPKSNRLANILLVHCCYSNSYCAHQLCSNALVGWYNGEQLHSEDLVHLWKVIWEDGQLYISTAGAWGKGEEREGGGEEGGEEVRRSEKIEGGRKREEERREEKRRGGGELEKEIGRR